MSSEQNDGPMTIERLARATGKSEAAIAEALFRMAALARKRGILLEEDAALRGLGEILAFAAAFDEVRHPPTSAETPDDQPASHEYP